MAFDNTRQSRAFARFKPGNCLFSFYVTRFRGARTLSSIVDGAPPLPIFDAISKRSVEIKPA